MLRRTVLLVSLALGLAAGAGVVSADVAWGQGRTIKFIVPFGAGSSIDILARVAGEEIGREQGATVTIENRLGAGTIIASDAVAAAPPDGNTVLFVTTAFLINPQLRKVTYDPFTSFEPVCHLSDQPNLFVVNATSPYRTLPDLINAAHANPGMLTLASVGPGSGSHIAFEKLKQMASMNMTFVPYQGIPPAVNALLGDHVTSALISYGDAIEQVEANRLRPLAVASLSRIQQMPMLPTVSESGYKNYEANIWYGALVPAKTAPDIVSRLSQWFTAALAAPDVRAKLAVQAFSPILGCGADFAAFLHRQYDDYAQVIRDANMKVE